MSNHSPPQIINNDIVKTVKTEDIIDGAIILVLEVILRKKQSQFYNRVEKLKQECSKLISSKRT